MALKLNGTTGYLEHNAKIVSAYPYSIMEWVSADGTGAGQFWLSQGQSNADRYAVGWLDANGSSKYATYRNPGSGDNATKTTSPNPNATMRLMVSVFASATDRKVYYGSSSSPGTSSASMTDSTSNHDRVVAGAYHYNNAAASLFTNGHIAEAHFFNVALTATDVDNLLADSVKPEAITGWVDGWTFETYSAGGTYTSLGGSRTMTAVGGVSVATITPSHPITRVAAVTGTIALTEGADTFAAAAEHHQAAIAFTEGADSFSIGASHSFASIGWTEAPDDIQMAGGMTASLAWVEGADTFAAQGVTQSGAVAFTENADTFAAASTYATAVALAFTEGADTFAAAGTSGPAMGHVTSPICSLLNGTVLSGMTGCNLNIFDPTGNLVLRATGLTTDSTGHLVVASTSLAAGTTYYVEPDLTSAGFGRRLPAVTAS
jgi:hypothetical protein